MYATILLKQMSLRDVFRRSNRQNKIGDRHVASLLAMTARFEHLLFEF